MSTRTALRPHSVIISGDMSANITSAATVLQSVTSVSFGVSWSASTAVGTVSVQVSNDYTLAAAGGTGNAGTWTTITVQYNGATVTTVPVTGSSGNGFIDIEKTAAYAIRLIYTAASGGGTMQAVIAGKVS